jgi:hypothetical protein
MSGENKSHDYSLSACIKSRMTGLEGLIYCELACPVVVSLQGVGGCGAISELGAEIPRKNRNTTYSQLVNHSQRAVAEGLWPVGDLDFLVLLHQGKRTKE